MPKTIYMPGLTAHSGIRVEWTPTADRIYFFAWSGGYGIDGESMSLGEFFRRLGITEKDVRKALRVGAA